MKNKYITKRGLLVIILSALAMVMLIQAILWMANQDENLCNKKIPNMLVGGYSCGYGNNAGEHAWYLVGILILVVLIFYLLWVHVVAGWLD